MLCKHHHYPFPELFIFPTEPPYPLNSNSPFPLTPAPGENYSLSVSRNLSSLGTAYKWNHAVFYDWLISPNKMKINNT